MEWIILGILFVFAWFFENFIHEGSHLLAGWLFEGRKPKLMIIWPHMFEGSFYFARYTCGPATKVGDVRYRHIAPLVASFVVYIVSLLTFALTLSDYALPFVICSLIDFNNWIFGYAFNKPKTDGFRFKTGE